MSEHIDLQDDMLQRAGMLKGIAMWLVDNTAVSFDQIADCCKLTIVDVQAIADNNMQVDNILDPVKENLLTEMEIELSQNDVNNKLILGKNKEVVRKRGRKSSSGSMSRRQSKPNAIAWLLKNCPSITDRKIIALVHTTSNTVKAIRDRSHWNMDKIKASREAVLEVCNKNDLEHILLMSKVINDRNKIMQSSFSVAKEMMSTDEA